MMITYMELEGGGGKGWCPLLYVFRADGQHVSTFLRGDREYVYVY